MTLAEVMREIKSRGKPNTVKVYQRHGVTEPTVGMSYADLGSVVKLVGVDHPLALRLWDTGLHDARIVATKVADPNQLTAKVLAKWLSACRNYVVTDAVAGTAARVPEILPIALAWTKNRGEWTAAAGWQVVAILVMRGGLDDKLADNLLMRVESEIHAAPNRARYSMNSALIAIGGSMPSLRARALRAAKAIGPVTVDHGETGCKTPAAHDMIGKMVAHRAAKRSGATGARVAAATRRRPQTRT